MTLPEPLWRVPSPCLGLEREEVHVWRARLEVTEPRVAALWQALSPDERRRAERFGFAEHRARFVVARGLLRWVLSRYLDAEPGELRFGYSASGKPHLASRPGRDGISFNLSHSGGLALYALARGRAIGVDVEQVRPEFPCAAVAERFFTPAERAALQRLPAEAQPAAFFAAWTRKEAYLKARGSGLALPLEEVEVSLLPTEPARLVGVRGSARLAERWSLRDLHPAPDYVAALAVAGHGWRLSCWRWPEEQDASGALR